MHNLRSYVKPSYFAKNLSCAVRRKTKHLENLVTHCKKIAAPSSFIFSEFIQVLMYNTIS